MKAGVNVRELGQIFWLQLPSTPDRFYVVVAQQQNIIELVDASQRLGPAAAAHE